MALVAIVVVAIGVRLWAASFSAANFDADEAIGALIARHTLEGRPAAFFYGQAYLGTIEQVVAAPFLALDADSVILVRLASLLLFGLALYVNYRLIAAWYAAPVALVAALLIALPTWVFFGLTFRSMTNTASLLLFGALALVSRRASVQGLALGLALWSNPLAIAYAVGLGVPALLGSAEWRALHQRLGARARALPIVGLGLTGCAVLVAFTAGCQPSSSLEGARLAAGTLMAVSGIGLAAQVGRVSTRRRELGFALGRFAAGLSVGLAPMLLGWLAAGQVSFGAVPACPTDIPERAALTLGNLVPLLWGVPGVGFPVGPLELGVGLVALCSLVAFAWRGRGAIRRSLLLHPIAQGDVASSTLMLLFAVPILLTVLGGNTHDLLHARYLAVAWMAGLTITATFLVWLGRRARLAAAAALVLVLWQTGIATLGVQASRLRNADPARVIASTAELSDFLLTRGVDAGYADYWVAYPFDFLASERVALAPYNAIDRYPPYSSRAGTAAILAYVLRPNLAPAGASDAGALAAALALDQPGGPAHPAQVERARRSTVVERTRVADWDVWLVRPP